MAKALRLPLVEALASGGDHRSMIGPNGLNKYGTATKPRNAVPFGSCTSSSSSARGYEAAARAFELLRKANNPPAAAQAANHAARRRLRQLLNIGPGVDIAFAPSGTDTELIAVALAAADNDRRITNIVVGPNEVGSGTRMAAAARHYDTLLPSGRAATVGDPVDEQLADRIDLELVPLRSDDGKMLEEAELDRHVVELVETAKARRSTVLLHVVAHSKTGMHAPSLDCVDELQRRHPDLVVMVDAAQGRFSRKGMAQALEKGHLFMITGSKFFGGPPFSGALLVPKQLSHRARSMVRFPRGFADYFSAVEMPLSWRSVRSALPPEPNYPAILRWAAAIAEIDRYYATPSAARLKVLRFFESEVPNVLSCSKSAELLAVYPPVYGEDRLLQSKTTVFNFRVRKPDGGWMDMLELRQLHGELNRKDPGAGELGRAFHLGQPVKIGEVGGALRIALGGELIVRVATDVALGASLEDRLAWLREQLVGLRNKVDMLVAAREPAAQLAAL